MKKLIFTLSLGLLFSFTLMAQTGITGVIKKATVAPVIDGQIDDVWAEANSYNIDIPFTGTNPTLGNAGETYWKGLWMDDGIYVLVVVNDDDWYPSYIAGGNSYEADKIELYFDVNQTLYDGGAPATGNGHYQAAPDPTATTVDGTAVTETNGVVHAYMVNDPDYLCEYFVPFTWLLDADGFEIPKTRTIGFDVTINDKDEATNVRDRAVWANDGSVVAEAWSNMDGCGEITLDGAVDNVLATSMSFEAEGGATTITTDNGTLQMVVTIEPADATVKTLAWKVTNGTGRARINSAGLLTALVDGTVTVTGETKDGSFKSQDLEITISGQYVTMNDINVVKDGLFDVVDLDGTVGPAWNGSAMVVDGVAVCDPADDGGIGDYWDWTLTQIVNCIDGEPYTFSFYTWSDTEGEFNVDFEDSNHDYARYGSSTSPDAVDVNGGTSNWVFTVTSTPVKKVYDVTFTLVDETVRQSMQFMLGKVDGPIYLDSVYLVADADLALLTTFPDAVKSSKVSSVQVYPNPVSDVVYVKLNTAAAKVEIYNSLGRKVAETVANANQAKFDVSDFARGIYFVKVNDSVVKFVK
ncbi:MAG: T9SS type A sorting domain-containing protein [Bacteroidales bacterium]|nr:T9SS type A sorting domain-containing protein [Bacteroidales bacterium]MCB9013600.1 T9SS type A sorting domain-containing protein [Bacteroidales bacterium]